MTALTTRRLPSVGIAPVLRGEGVSGAPEQAFDVELAGGRVTAVVPVPGPVSRLLLPGLCDLHVHLDKNHTVAQTGAADGDLFAAIERMGRHRGQWTPDDLRDRMTRGVQEAWQNGTRALRTHLDWMDATRPLSLTVLGALIEAWHGRMELQCVSLTPLDAMEDAGTAGRIAAELAAFNLDHRGEHRGDRSGSGIGPALMGGFIYRNADLIKRLDRLLGAAADAGLAVDLHVDEGLDVEAAALAEVARLTVVHGLQGRVTCGHACSLSVQPPAQVRDTLALCAQAGIHLVALPTTNLYLQGDWQGTPVQRGITRLREAREAGVSVSLATDNVADPFYPYGSYDLLETFGLGVLAAHLSAPADWLDAITVAPARAMQLDWDGRIGPGCPAHLVLTEAASDRALLSGAGRRRSVIQPESVS